MWFVYILLCEDQSLYTGASTNIERRFKEHQSGRGGHYTRSHKPLKIIYKEQFSTKGHALKREIEIKGWNRGEKIRILRLDLT